jgi:adhesion G protein-coupled receptor L1
VKFFKLFYSFIVKPTQQTPPLSIDDNSNVNNKINPHVATTLPASVLKNSSRQTTTIIATNTMNKNTNNNNIGGYEQHLFCGSVHARNLFWNVTRVGEVNVQPCPGGATGIAKWRCVHVAAANAGNFNNFSILNNNNNNNNNGDIRNSLILNSDNNKNGLLSTVVAPVQGFDDEPTNTINNKNTVAVQQLGGNSQAHWQPNSPDLSQCRSLWLNNLEVRVHQRDSSLISIATDLSQVI